MFNSTLLKEVFYQSRIPQLIGCIDFTNMQYNPAFCDFLGFTMDELASLSIEEVSHKEDLANDVHLFREILSGRRNEYEIEKRYIHKSGAIKTGILNVSKIKAQGTEEEYILAQVIDITEKKQMETVLRESEQKYRLLAEHSSDVIVLHQVDFSCQYISPSVKTVLGYELVELLGKNPEEFIHPDDMEAMLIQLKLIGPENTSMLVTYRCKKKDGNFIWLESTIKALIDPITGKVKEIVTVSRDIQHRIETGERLRKSEKLAVVGQMAAAVAHEIRNPLTPIKGFMQLLNTEKEINPVYLGIVLDELQRLEVIISEFLTMAKPHAEKTSLVQINSLVGQVVQLLQTQALMKNLEVNFTSINSVPSIIGDPNSLKQVFMNVIQNALDALSEKGRIDVSICVDKLAVIIKIKDNGCGIPEERLLKLGEPFYSTKEKGTGLGLMTSFRIIESHHGKIKVESEEGRGTTVIIWLPIHQKNHSN
ncbi:PAS domain S-box protein [Paenibacillus sp. BSR1-1]|uniref:PAS domain-containing sensor histidine kinase n=1 Tax=Paenibacillus sp. BSR1-1 TaxID=3020845 RepID=UPI0025AF0739|nr:PAS domain S-box protein [Paenibacillus sp. BSR1-1]MDN3015231.1 PAS domain S-box protein [Paenibacillus sp. BSR1-1]